MKIDWQRGKIVVTLEANDLEADWKGFLTAVREEVPSRHREYRSDEKAWIINKRYAPLVDELARQYLATDSQVVVESRSEEPPISFPMPHVASLLPSEEPTSVLAPSVASVAVQDATEGVPSSALVSSSPSIWPFFLLSLTFTIIGWWMTLSTFPLVWHYLHLYPRVFPLFDGIILGFSAVAGLGSTIYAIRLLYSFFPAFSILAHESRNDTVRLNTSRGGL